MLADRQTETATTILRSAIGGRVTTDDVRLSVVDVFLQVDESDVQSVEHLSHVDALVVRHLVDGGVAMMIRRLERLLQRRKSVLHQLTHRTDMARVK